MCGICGLLRHGPLDGEDQAIVDRMMASLAHRGPDGHGCWRDADTILGHRRLAVVDLAGGSQPMFNESGEVAVVFNGEIYNHQNLRESLVGAGHRFRTRSDTEVLVHGYEEWGDGLVERLRGMFAFALRDSARRRLLLARDRLGIKPLYYYVHTDSGRTLFASEIKALLFASGVPRALNEARLAEYLIYRNVAGEETLFAGIRELEPGTLMVCEGSTVQRRRYWSTRVAPRIPSSARDEIERGDRLLRDSVDARLMSDVSLGTITSGGIDSSLVSAIAAEFTTGPIDTFCVGFSDPAYDERGYARLVASHIRSRHHEIEVASKDIDREIDRLTWAHDEPLTHPNSIPMHLIFREAKEKVGVTVLLSGEGADEVFGGYDWYAVARRRDSLRRIPLLAPFARAVRIGKFRVLARVLSEDYLLFANSVSDPKRVARVLDRERLDLEHRAGLWPPGYSDSSDGLFLYDQATYLPPLLQRQDRMSMAAGLEARVPFLDHHLVEWANSLSAKTKIGDGRSKRLLKDVARRWLPTEIIDRRKIGFALPLMDWLRPSGLLATRVERLKERDSIVAGIIPPKRLAELTEDPFNDPGAADLLWTLIALDAWARVFLSGPLRSEVLPGAHSGRSLAARG